MSSLPVDVPINYNKEGVRPGEKAELTVIYEAEKAEHFSKTVTIIAMQIILHFV